MDIFGGAAARGRSQPHCAQKCWGASAVWANGVKVCRHAGQRSISRLAWRGQKIVVASRPARRKYGCSALARQGAGAGLYLKTECAGENAPQDRALGAHALHRRRDQRSGAATAGQAGLNKGEARNGLARGCVLSSSRRNPRLHLRKSEIPGFRPQSSRRRCHLVEHRLSRPRRRRTARPWRSSRRRSARPCRPARLGAHRLQRWLHLADIAARICLPASPRPALSRPRRGLAYNLGKILRRSPSDRPTRSRLFAQRPARKAGTHRLGGTSSGSSICIHQSVINYNNRAVVNILHNIRLNIPHGTLYRVTKQIISDALKEDAHEYCHRKPCSALR